MIPPIKRDPIGKEGSGCKKRQRIVWLMEAGIGSPRTQSFHFCSNTHIFSRFWYESTRCTNEALPRFQRFLRPYLPTPGLRHGLDEENNPATVRWIDTMRTYVDMWGCTRLITPEASWDAERLKRPYPSSSVLSALHLRFSSLYRSASLSGLVPALLTWCLQPTLQMYRISALRFPNWRVGKLVLHLSWGLVAGCSRMHCLHRWGVLQTNRSS